MISVITITFNNFKELSDTLESVSDDEIESVVINGGSCIETRQFLTNYGVSVSEKDDGISDAFNKGFLKSTGDLITYLNSGDVLLDKTYYQEAQKIFENDTDIDFVYADISYEDTYAGQIRVRSNQSFPCMPYLHPTLIVKRRTFEKVGMFDKSFAIAMDLDFAYRLINSGAKGHYIPKMVIQMDGGGVSSSNFHKTYYETVRVIFKNGDYSIRSLIYIFKTGVFLILKMLLLKTGGGKILGIYRKKRFSSKSK
jgi:GT2 family glycosyltransferase